MVREATQIIRDSNLRGSIVPVLPDVMGKGNATLVASMDAYEQWAKEPAFCDGLMLVTQGENWLDFTNLVNYFFIHHRTKYSNINWVGIPRKLLAAGISRVHAVRYIQTVAPWVKIHLLGFSDDIQDDMAAARLPGVEGIDSAVPVRYNDSLTPTTTEEQIGPRGDWMENGRLTNQNILNIRNVRMWVENRYND
jgi:hypothetical protein